MEQTLDISPTEMYYLERSVYKKGVHTNNNWTFELGHSGESPPVYVIVGFQAREKLIHNYLTTPHLINFKLVMLFVK